LEHVLALLLVTQPHNALLTVLLDLAAQEPLELPAVAEIKIKKNPAKMAGK